MNDASHPLEPDSAYQARQWLTGLGAKLAERGIVLRDPPEEPTSCCGRGCNGCVWEGYFTAVGYWCEQAQEALQKQG